jgi:5'-deoxynucleotidase YfbR-like HD superfamily hydrolase
MQEILDQIEFLFEQYSRERRATTQPYLLQVAQERIEDYAYYPEDDLVRETLIEHVASLPMLGTALYPYIDDGDVDLGQSLIMMAIHDIGELITGDEMIFTKKADAHIAERAAARKLLHPLYHDIYDDAETKTSTSAKKEEYQADIQQALESIGGAKDSYTPDEMQRIFQAFIQQRGYDKAGWTAAVIANRSACLASLMTKVIEIGADRTIANRRHDKVIQSLIHEAGVHVRRYTLGSNMGSGLAGKGLAKYTFFEEPFAGSIEDMYFGNTKQRGQGYTIALGLAMGIDGTPRDYHDTDELYWRMAFAQRYDATKPFDAQVATAQRAAERSLVRIWRGMPTDIPGCVLTKDYSYENTDVLRLLQNGGVPLPRADLLRFLSAKYDPRDPDQDAYIRQFDPACYSY